MHVVSWTIIRISREASAVHVCMESRATHEAAQATTWYLWKAECVPSLSAVGLSYNAGLGGVSFSRICVLLCNSPERAPGWRFRICFSLDSSVSWETGSRKEQLRLPGGSILHIRTLLSELSFLLTESSQSVGICKHIRLWSLGRDIKAEWYQCRWVSYAVLLASISCKVIDTIQNILPLLCWSQAANVRKPNISNSTGGPPPIRRESSKMIVSTGGTKVSSARKHLPCDGMMEVGPSFTRPCRVFFLSS